MRRKISRKGAIEMSMTTIIVVILGITMLSLGLMFVRNIFKDITSKQQKIGDLSEKEITELFGESEDPIYLPRNDIIIKQGDRENVDVLIRNSGSQESMFKYEPKLEDGPEGVTDAKVKSWMTWKKAGSNLKSGKGYKDILTITVPKSAKLGLYRFSLALTCGDEDLCPTDIVLTVEVK